MFGALTHSSGGKLCFRAHARGSDISSRVVGPMCRAATRSPSDKSQSLTARNVDRRQVLSLLLAAGTLLLPARPTLAEEAELDTFAVSPQAAPVLELESAAQAPQAVSDAAEVGAVADSPDNAPAPDAVEAAPEPAAEPSTSGAGSVAASGPKQVFMDVTINGEPAGRIIIQLFDDVPVGASRFVELAAGRQGVDYRLSKFNGVLPTYIRNDGLSRLSYSANEVSPISSGDSLDTLEAELDRQARRHDKSGLVSLIVRERDARPVKERLVARDGKLITVLEQAGEAPNGTQFTITTAASPELDATNLIIGRLVGGEELLRRIASLPVNRPRNDNPYFQAGKAIGDKRAVTAERAFYRPFQKVVVSSSGVIS